MLIGDRGLRCLLQAVILSYHQFLSLQSHNAFALASGQVATSAFFILSGLSAGISLGRNIAPISPRKYRMLSAGEDEDTDKSRLLIGIAPVQLSSLREFVRFYWGFWLRRAVPLILSICLLTPLYLQSPTNFVKHGHLSAMEPFINTWFLKWGQIPHIYFPNPTLWFVSNLLLFWTLAPLVALLVKGFRRRFVLCLIVVFLVLDQTIWFTMPAPGSDWRLWESLYISPLTHATQFLAGLAGGVWVVQAASMKAMDGRRHSSSWLWWYTDMIAAISMSWAFYLLSRPESLRPQFRQADWRFGLNIPCLILLLSLCHPQSQKSFLAHFLGARWFTQVCPRSLPVVIYITHWSWNSLFIGVSQASPYAFTCCITLYPFSLLLDNFVHTRMARLVSQVTYNKEWLAVIGASDSQLPS